MRGAFSLHEPDRRPYRAAEGTPSLTALAVGVASVTARMDVTAGSQRGNTDPTWWIEGTAHPRCKRSLSGKDLTGKFTQLTFKY